MQDLERNTNAYNIQAKKTDLTSISNEGEALIEKVKIKEFYSFENFA